MKTVAQVTGKNRPLTVVTSDLMLFTMDAEQWELARYTANGQPRTSIQVFKAQPGNGTPSKLIAEFPDISAVYFSDDVLLVKPDD